MRNGVERLRVWLLGGAIVLVVVIAAFIGWARHLRREFLGGLPARLGIDVVRETNGYKYCLPIQGRTVYCIHASKAIEHKDGKIALHDVSIILYGKQGDRNDRIYGDEFEYDKNAKVVRATGVVHIDLQSAETGGAGKSASSEKVMHVTTSGLVYLEKLGLAATSEPIDFEAGGMTGHAVGADYSSDSGMLLLHSAVTMSGIAGGHPLSMTAATAEYGERSGQVLLTRATYDSEGRKAAADEATLYRRPDGSLARVVAKGNVTVEAKGSTVRSQAADITLTATSQPQDAVLTEAVTYVSDEPLRQVRGRADEATIAFDGQAKPRPKHAVFTGGVQMSERTRTAVAAGDAWSVRDLTAAKLDASLVSAGMGRSQVQDAVATGNARLNIVELGKVAGKSTTEVSADELSAHMIVMGDAKLPPQLDTIAGRGNTVLHQVTASGTEQTTSADTLDAKMRPGAMAKGTKASVAGASDKVAVMLLRSVQQGHVAMMRRVPAKAVAKTGAAAAGLVVASGGVEHALADRAVYDGELDRMTLSGGVQVWDADSMLWANQIALDRKTGDENALGAVKVSYSGNASPGSKGRVNAPPAEPMHVLADRADLVHASSVATFYGRPVRLWQGGSQIQAPVIELSKGEKGGLVARGDGTARTVNSAQVQTVLARSGGNASGAAGTGSSGAASAGRCESSTAAKKNGGDGVQTHSDDVIRIASGGLNYSGATEQADFTGGFLAETVDGTIRAGEGIAYLRQGNMPTDGGTAASAKVSAAPALSGDLDRVVATGSVELDRPGLKSTGTRLVYTASDGSALLTGDERNPPKAVEAQGSTTGNALLFRSSCDGRGGGSVEVLGSAAKTAGEAVGAAAGQRVHTDLRLDERKKNGKGK